LSDEEKDDPEEDDERGKPYSLNLMCQILLIHFSAKSQEGWPEEEGL
jgi:hypothetical protein